MREVGSDYRVLKVSPGTRQVPRRRGSMVTGDQDIGWGEVTKGLGCCVKSLGELCAGWEGMKGF